MGLNDVVTFVADLATFYRPDQRRDRGRFADEGRGRAAAAEAARRKAEREANRRRGPRGESTRPNPRKGAHVEGPLQEQILRVAQTRRANMFDTAGVRKVAEELGFTELTDYLNNETTDQRASWLGMLNELDEELALTEGRGEEHASEGKYVRVNLGITPYKGKPIAEVEGIEGYYQSNRYKAWLTDVRMEAQRIGVKIEDVVKVAGVWAGKSEPSASVWVRGEMSQVEQFASSLGSEYNQEGVLLFTADEDDGRGALYTMPGVEDRDKAVQALQKAGIDGGRVVQARNGEYVLEVADLDGSLYDKVLKVGKNLGTQIFGTPGKAKLLFGGEHYERRKRPHRGRGVTYAGAAGGAR